MKKITVFTATFNRANKLPRAFNSLLKQTSKDFEWLIIDDGSSDNTEAIVNSFKEKADFPIRYFWKENGGRHTAANYSYKYINTPYVVTLDSDDELTSNAIELMIKTWESIPIEKYNKCWCISGREIDSRNNSMIGKAYPQNINNLTGKKLRKEILKYPGEKHCCRKTEILIQYPFPIYPDTKFVTENVVWEQINRSYDQWCVNDIYGIYHSDSSDGLTNKGIHKNTRHRTFYYAGLFYVNYLFDEFFYNRQVPYYVVNVSRCAMLTNTSYLEVMKSINKWYKRVFVTFGYPISALWIFFHKKQL
ncbi:glycosyltransferase family 2 protein [Galactobacillus timonensis]|uniref:glycosyltransferase family 2 protein n=1 Tax=Galactobacillus timonensis TaxID=2041840 RepID=UPI000C817D8F|nr:glycosyltransferase family A protein [Galactobacillus timonensis]